MANDLPRRRIAQQRSRFSCKGRLEGIPYAAHESKTSQLADARRPCKTNADRRVDAGRSQRFHPRRDTIRLEAELRDDPDLQIPLRCRFQLSSQSDGQALIAELRMAVRIGRDCDLLNS